jgi:hypothetical protein
MSEFELGFFEQAKECRLPEKQAAYIWKRALEYPGTEAMFKELDIKDRQEASPATAVEMQELSKILEQQKVHEEINKLKQQLGI